MRVEFAVRTLSKNVVSGMALVNIMVADRQRQYLRRSEGSAFRRQN